MHFCVVGAGLAGVNFALLALSRGHEVTLLHAGSRKSPPASRAAGGLMNAVTGPRLNPSWKSQALFQHARLWYRHLENILDTSFYEDWVLCRALEEKVSLRAYHKRIRRWDGRNWFLPEDTYHTEYRRAEQRWGCEVCLLPVGRLHVQKLLSLGLEYLSLHGSVLEKEVDFHAHDASLTSVQQTDKRHREEWVVYCLGSDTMDHPLLSNLPIVLARGEVLEVEYSFPPPPAILNRYRKWMIPGEEQRAWVGATYEQVGNGGVSTDDGKDVLLNAANAILPDNPVLRVCDHRAGIRACSTDQLPYVGVHPQQPGLATLCALGSKGVLMAPWTASVLLSHLEGQIALPGQIDLRRCWAKK